MFKLADPQIDHNVYKMSKYRRNIIIMMSYFTCFLVFIAFIASLATLGAVLRHYNNNNIHYFTQFNVLSLCFEGVQLFFSQPAAGLTNQPLVREPP
jgi:hypothetical protein